jgi:hypothetical protein
VNGALDFSRCQYPIAIKFRFWYKAGVDPKVKAFNDQQHAAARARAERAIRLKNAGETWETIGKLLGVSRQRAQALAKAHSAK